MRHEHSDLRRGLRRRRGGPGWSTRTTTRRSASSAAPASRRSSAPTASWRASSTPTSPRRPAPRTASRRSPRPTRSSRTPRSARSTTSSARRGSRRRARRRRPPPPGWEQVIFGRRPGRPAVEYDFGGGGLGGSGFSSFFEMLFGQQRRRRRGGPAGGRRAAGGYRGDCAAPRRRPGGAHPAHPRGGGRGRRARHHPHRSADRTQQTVRVKIPRGIRPGAEDPPRRPRAPRAAAAGRRATSTSPSRCCRTPASGSRATDLHTTLPITPWEAALGGTAQLETLDGPVTVRIPAGSPAGRKIRLRGYGYPADEGGQGRPLRRARRGRAAELTHARARAVRGAGEGFDLQSRRRRSGEELMTWTPTS